PVFHSVFGFDIWRLADRPLGQLTLGVPAMTRFSTTRRTLLKATALALVASGLVACSKTEANFQGSDITGSNLGKDLAMVDHTGQPRTLADFKGKVLVVFFGFTQCPDVCPTAMAQMAQAVELLGEDAA